MDVTDATLADNLGREDTLTDTNFAIDTIDNDINIIRNDDTINEDKKITKTILLLHQKILTILTAIWMLIPTSTIYRMN